MPEETIIYKLSSFKPNLGIIFFNINRVRAEPFHNIGVANTSCAVGTLHCEATSFAEANFTRRSALLSRP